MLATAPDDAAVLAETGASTLLDAVASGRHWLPELLARAVLIAATLLWFPMIFWGDVPYYWDTASGASLQALPYRDFVWEFPPLTLVPTTLALLPGGVTVFMFAFPTAMAGAEYASLVLLRRSWPSLARSVTLFWYGGLPLSVIAYFRFDYLAVLCAVLALVALERGWRAPAAVAAGFFAKLWPAVLLVLFVTRRRWGEAARTVGVIGAGMVAWWAFSPEGVHDFLAYRKGSGFQVESTVGAVGVLLGAEPFVRFGAWNVELGAWQILDPLLLAGWLVLSAWVISRAARGVGDPVLMVGGLIVALMLASRLLSPQFVVWPLPFVALAWARGTRPPAYAYLLAVVLTLFEVFGYAGLLAGDSVIAAGVVYRNVLLAATAYGLVTNTCTPMVDAGRLPSWRTPSSSGALASTTSGTSPSSFHATASSS